MADDGSSTWIRRCPECDCLVDPQGMETITCRNGHTFERDDAFAVTYCEGCGTHERSIPGVRFPTATNSDESREWIEHCDLCEDYESDADAADALVKAGRVEGWRWAAASGCVGSTPYAVPEEAAGP